MCSARAAMIALALLAGPAARATTVELPSPAELFGRTEVVARVRVLAQEVDVDERGRARTWTTLVVREAVAGATVGERLLLYQPGDLEGRRGGVLGQARHRVGDEVVLFLARARIFGRRALIHRGLGYGVYDVASDGALVERPSEVARVPAAAGAVPARFPSLRALAELARSYRQAPP